MLALPPSAPAGTISVEEGLPKGGQHISTLSFRAAPGETNALRVTIATAAKPGEIETLRVRDASARLIAGRGCTGGGPAGRAALCEIHAPREPEQILCGKMCLAWKAGTGYWDYFQIHLGGRADSFDGSTFDSGSIADQYPMTVDAGAGDDRVATGSSGDEVDAGAGRDQVFTAGGGDTVTLGPATTRSTSEAADT